QPINFEAPVPILSLYAEIIAETLCPDQPDAALSLSADLTEIIRIEWWFTDFNGNRTRLNVEPNSESILARNEGTYEVFLYNKFNCLLGQDQVLVLRSTDSIRPAIEDTYQICPRYEIAPQINPGNFSSYEWYLNETLVATSATFKPNQIGTYKLIVYSSEGCAYEASFLTEEECELRVAFPNAMQPDNSDKPFLIYTNYLIDELEIWIFSKWGQVIYHCKKTELISQESTCLWDGYFNGEKLPPGSYAYRMNFRNNERKISKEQLGSILVID
ncbi:gliding motility-associated C-terminal domain-containing protein, partial [Algoriphagus sp.]